MADTKLEIYVKQVLPPERKEAIRKSLPAHVNPEVFERNLFNAIMANPDLSDFHPSFIFREVSKAAGIGLLLDPILGEGYIVPAWNSQSRQKEPQLRVGYRGLMKLARISLGGATIYAHEVCEHDGFTCHLGDDKCLRHSPDVFSERGEIKGYYAVIRFRDGTSDFECMSVAQIHAIRDRSDAWGAFSTGKIKSTPWSTDEVEMAKKTVIRRLLKRCPASPELAQAIAIEDRAEFPQFEKRPPGRPPRATVEEQPREKGLSVVDKYIPTPPPPPPEDDGEGDGHARTADDGMNDERRAQTECVDKAPALAGGMSRMRGDPHNEIWPIPPARPPD